MKQALIECVPNLSEGRDPERIRLLTEAVANVAGAALLHVTSDADHHRSVVTFAGTEEAVAQAALELARKAVELIDLNRHTGVHPRLGALDVLPFVPLEGSSLADCVRLAHAVGERIWRELEVPVYFYESAALRPERKRLEEVRRGGFEGIRQALADGDISRTPDLGKAQLHPSAGAIIVGARPFLIAYNINLRTSDVGVAKEIARGIRTSSGGLPAVKALGLALESRRLVQVSMNLTDFETTPVHVVFQEVARLAAAQGVEIQESEFIGLIPRRALEMAAAGLLKLQGFDGQRVVESRLETVLTQTGIGKS